MGEDSSFERVADYLGISDVTSKKKKIIFLSAVAWRSSSKSMINYSPTKDISIECHQVYSSSVSFMNRPVLQMSHHYIKTLTWGVRKDNLRAIPTQVLVKQNLCHTPDSVIPTAIIHDVLLAPLFLQPTSTPVCLVPLFLQPIPMPYAWTRYSHSQYPQVNSDFSTC